MGCVAKVLGAFALSWVPLFAGCTALEGSREHIVMFDSDGRAVAPYVEGGSTRANDRIPNADSTAFEPTGEWHDYLERMFAAAHAAGADPQKRRLVVYIHGGLNTPRGTLERVNRLLAPMTEDGYFPIFVNWRSSLVSSWFEHLLYVRQGEDWGWWGVPFAPFFLTHDVARAVIRAPFVWTQEVMRLFNTFPGYKSAGQEKADEIGDELVRGWNGGAPAVPSATPIARDRDVRTGVEVGTSFTSWLLTFPFKLVSGPFVDAFGQPAWEVMSRRVHLLLDSGGEPREGKAATRRPQLLQFSARLARFQREEAALGRDWELVLIGHSMGSMVANGLLLEGTRTPAAATPRVAEFDRIVYLSAACSMRDWEEAVVPYLLRHGQSRFYLVALNDKAEDGERNAYDLSPRGSLLDWIDAFLVRPMAPLDHTAGRFHNFLLAYSRIEADLRSRIHVREFGLGDGFDGKGPQKHGEFDGYEFWQPAFYDPKLAPPSR